MVNLAPQKLEMMYLDPTCETAIRRMAKHESREPQKITTPEDLKMQIATMLMMAERVKKAAGPKNITLVRHPLVPTFRVSIIDNDIMYLGEYLPGSCGFESDLVVLKSLGEKPSLYATFQRYCERTRMIALMHLVARAAICESFRDRLAVSLDIRF